MSKVFIEESTLVGMADLIRESKGTTDLYDPANFRDEFREIIVSGSGVLPPVLQEKTITENGEYTADTDYDGLGKVTVNVQPKLQEKSVTDNGEVTADEGYDGLSKVTVDVAGGSSVEGGFTVNFYDADKVLIESHSVELGVNVYTPVEYSVDFWIDSDGNYYTFPLTCNEVGKVYDLYLAEAPTCERIIYSHCGVNEEEYPYLVLLIPSSYTALKFDVTFWKDLPTYNGTRLLLASGSHCLRSELLHGGDDITTAAYDIVSMTSIVKSYSISLTQTSSTNYTWVIEQSTEGAKGTMYTNFDLSGNTKGGRLDATIYDLDGTLQRPYELQEKTVTENGEVVADEGYYGLSKVIVDVASDPVIDGGYTVNFYNDESLLIQSVSALYGMTVDRPIGSAASVWTNDKGEYEEFPITIAQSDDISIINVYPNYLTYSSILHNLFGIDPLEYPYICIAVSSYSTQNYIWIYFAKTITQSDGTILLSDVKTYSKRNQTLKTKRYSMPSMSDALNYIISEGVSAFSVSNETSVSKSLNSSGSYYGYYDYYGNFENTANTSFEYFLTFE